MHFLNPGAFCYYIYDKYYLSSVLGREPMTLVLLDQHCTAELLQQSNWFYKDTRCTCLYINLKYLICSCVKKNDGCSNIHLKCALLIFTGVKTYYIFSLYSVQLLEMYMMGIYYFFTGSLIFFLLFKLKKMEQQQQVGDVLEFIL